MSAGALRRPWLLRASPARFSRRLHGGTTPRPLYLSSRLGLKLGFRPSYSAPLRYEYVRVPIVGLPRWYSSDQGDEEGKEAIEEQEETEEEQDDVLEDILEDEETVELLPVTRHQALAAQNVPKDFPDVPLLPISRSPIFPHLARMMEARKWEDLMYSVIEG